MKRLLSLSLLGILLAITLSGCESKDALTSKDIVGRWRQESAEAEGKVEPTSVLLYWEFFSNGVFTIKEGNKLHNTYNWEIIDSKLIVNGHYDNYYRILKLTKNKLDLGLAQGANEEMLIYHLVKANP